MVSRLYARLTPLVIFALLLGALPHAAQAAPAQQSDFITVTIKRGDTLLAYTLLYGVTGSAIVGANTIPDVNNIPLGTVIVIPVVKSYIPSLTTPFYYIAQSGDTLTSLATRFEMYQNTIARANGGKTTLTAGETYLIPAGPHLYTVKRGDTLKIISQRYRTTVEFILKGNALPNPDIIYPNQQLFIPIQYNVAPLAIPDVVIAPPPASTETASGSTSEATSVPSSAPTATPGKPAPTAVASLDLVPGQYLQVRLKAGENFLVYSIRYGVNGTALRNANPQIKDPNNFPIGTVVTIPVIVSFTPSRTTPFFYVVQDGDNATTIASKFEMTADTLIRVNPNVKYTSGITVLVPPGPHMYTVKQGDTLKIVAAIYGTTVEKLLAYNALPNPDVIYPDQQIYIPVQYNAKPLPF